MKRTVGSFLPTTQVWDVSEIRNTDVTSPAFKELLIRLYQNLNKMALAINDRKVSVFSSNECLNGQKYPANSNSTSSTTPTSIQREGYHTWIDIGALPTGATTVKPHGLTISNSWSFMRIYGCASYHDRLPANSRYCPIPYVGAAGNIEIYSDDINVTLINTTGINFTACYVVMEYLKS